MKKITILSTVFLMLGCAAAEHKTNNFDDNFGQSIQYNIDTMKVPQNNLETKPAYEEINTQGVSSTKTIEPPMGE